MLSNFQQTPANSKSNSFCYSQIRLSKHNQSSSSFVMESKWQHARGKVRRRTASTSFDSGMAGGALWGQAFEFNAGVSSLVCGVGAAEIWMTFWRNRASPTWNVYFSPTFARAAMMRTPKPLCRLLRPAAPTSSASLWICAPCLLTSSRLWPSALSYVAFSSPTSWLEHMATTPRPSMTLPWPKSWSLAPNSVGSLWITFHSMAPAGTHLMMALFASNCKFCGLSVQFAKMDACKIRLEITTRSAASSRRVRFPFPWLILTPTSRAAILFRQTMAIPKKWAKSNRRGMTMLNEMVQSVHVMNLYTYIQVVLLYLWSAIQESRLCLLFFLSSEMNTLAK